MAVEIPGNRDPFFPLKIRMFRLVIIKKILVQHLLVTTAQVNSLG